MPDSTIQCSLQACTRTTRDFSCSSHYLWLRAQVLRALERRAIRNRLADYSVGMASFLASNTNANAYAQCHRRVLWLRGYQRARAAYLGRARAPASLVQHLSRAHPYLACGKDKGEKRGVNRAPCVCTHEVRLSGFERSKRLSVHSGAPGARSFAIGPGWQGMKTVCQGQGPRAGRCCRSGSPRSRAAHGPPRWSIDGRSWQHEQTFGCNLYVAQAVASKSLETRSKLSKERTLSLSLCKREKRCSASCSTEQSRRAALVVYVTTSERRAILM